MGFAFSRLEKGKRKHLQREWVSAEIVGKVVIRDDLCTHLLWRRQKHKSFHFTFLSPVIYTLTLCFSLSSFAASPFRLLCRGLGAGQKCSESENNWIFSPTRGASLTQSYVLLYTKTLHNAKKEQAVGNEFMLSTSLWARVHLHHHFLPLFAVLFFFL